MTGLLETINRSRHVRLWLPLLAAIIFNLAPMSMWADPQNGDLPIFTSPIDITGFGAQLRVEAPDKDTGQKISVPIPLGLLSPKMNQFFSTPLSTMIDQFWTSADPSTHVSPKDQACNGPKGIVPQVNTAVHKIGSAFNAYDVSCDLASTGKLLLQQVGSVLYLGYLLTSNKVAFSVTTPGTCNPSHARPLCPNDPRFTVTFAVELVTLVRTPALCSFSAESGTAVVQNVSIDGNMTGQLAMLADDLFLGHQFPAAERAIESSPQPVTLPLDSSFQEMRQSPACNGTNPTIAQTMQAFREFHTTVKLPPGIIFEMIHPPTTPPTVTVPDPSSTASTTPAQPTFTRPMISTNKPSVVAGTSVVISGHDFPLNPNLSTALPVSIGHGGYGENSIVLGGPCFGGGSDLKWGPANAAPSVQRVPGTSQAPCAVGYNATNLTPGTSYQFSARDCDAVTCSLWGPAVRVTTQSASSAMEKGRVVLTLDGVSTLGSGTIAGDGTFSSTVTIPSSVTPGTHHLRAADGQSVAEAALGVTAGAASAKASMMMVGVLGGETGCPNHPITSTRTDASFMLFGSGFAAGAISIHLDTTSGFAVGAATAGADGTFCQRMNAVPSTMAGSHTLVAVENGAVQAQTPLVFVVYSGPN